MVKWQKLTCQSELDGKVVKIGTFQGNDGFFEIDGLILEGKLGKTFDLDELVEQEKEQEKKQAEQAKWQEKKQCAIDFIRKVLVAALSLLFIMLACCAFYNVIGPKVVAAVEAFDYQAMIPSIDFSFLETGPASTKMTTTMPFSMAENVHLVQRQVTPAHLDEARGLALYELVQELMSSDQNLQQDEEEDDGEKCCHRDDVVCRAKALLLHSMPEDLASYLTTVLEEPQVEQVVEEPIDSIGFVLEHEFLFYESVAEEDSKPTSDVYQQWFKWIFDWLSTNDQTAVTFEEPASNETTTPVDSPTPTIFPLDADGYGLHESNSPTSDVCPNDDNLVDIVVLALHQVDAYLEEQVISWCGQASSSGNAAWAMPLLCY